MVEDLGQTLIMEKYVENKLMSNIRRLRQDLGDGSDLTIRFLEIGKHLTTSVAIARLEGISDEQRLTETVIQPLIESFHYLEPSCSLWEEIQNTVLATAQVRSEALWHKIMEAILAGDTVIFVDGYAKSFLAETKGIKERAIAEPTTQSVIRGPKDSFVESIRTNTSLIRKRVTSKNLRIEPVPSLQKLQTKIELVYLKNRVNPTLLQEIRHRIQQIDKEVILESGELELQIQDKQTTVFPTILHTERPDVVVANILEGRVGIFVDGTPFVLIAPSCFVQFFQSPDDYYQRFDIGVFLRTLRFITFFFSLLAPSTYIALITYHQAMIPTTLLISLYAQREGVPFPPLIEAIIMEFLFEILREAGVRVPTIVGQTISIVGALVLGQAAVQAGLVSTSMLIVVSITAISSYAIPQYNLAISTRLLRFLFMFIAFVLGFYGILLGLFVLFAHLYSLHSFGYLYMSTKLPSIQKATQHRSVWERIFDIEKNDGFKG